MQYSLRRSRSGDEKKLKDIWQICFSDPDEYIDSFFEKMYRPGRAVVAEAEAERELCAAMYVLEAGDLAMGRCGYLYALGTLPNYRGSGIGAAVAKGAAALGFELGYDICVTCPAEQGLFDYYRKLGFLNFSKISRLIYSISDLHSRSFNGHITSISAHEYNKLREKFVPENAVRYSGEFMEYLSETFRQSGGGLFTLDTGKCIAAVETGADVGDGIIIKELLGGSGQADTTVELLMRHFSAKRASVVIPAGVRAPAIDHTVAIYRSTKAIDQIGDAYFPFTLD